VALLMLRLHGAQGSRISLGVGLVPFNESVPMGAIGKGPRIGGADPSRAILRLPAPCRALPRPPAPSRALPRDGVP